MNQYTKSILNNTLARLDPDDPAFTGSSAIAACLRDPTLRNYLRSWVLPPITALRDGDVPSWMREHENLTACRVRATRTRAAQS